MLARRAFVTTALTVASGILAAPGLAVGQGGQADQPSGRSTGSPHARGRSRGLPSNTAAPLNAADASEPRASGSPSSRGHRRATDRAATEPPAATVIEVADEATDGASSRPSRRRDTATLR